MRRLCLVILVLFAGIVLGKGSIPLADAADYLITADGGGCNSIGRWDATSHTCTLTGDVHGSIEIRGSGITLDGAGYALIGPTSYINGLEIREYNRMIEKNTVRNLTIRGWQTGIDLYRAYYTTLERVQLTDNAVGMQVSDTSGLTITDSTITGNAVGLNTTNSFSGLVLKNVAFVGNEKGLALNINTSHPDLSIDRSNTLDGKPIIYVEGETDTSHENLGEIGVLFCVRCTDVIFDGFSINGGNGPDGTGVSLYDSSGNTIRNATIEGVKVSVAFFRSDRNSFFQNTFRIVNIHPETGVAVGAVLGLNEHNVFLDNNFIETGDLSATSPLRMGHQNTAVQNSLFDAATKRGNYWSRFDTPEEGCLDADNDGRCDGYFNLDVGQYYPVSIEYAWTMQNGWSESPSIPTIISISPNSGPVGTLVTITGNNFGDNQDDGTLTFSSTEVVVLSWSDTKIDVKVPQLPVGSYDVFVTANNVQSNSMIFEVIDIDGNDQLRIVINASSDQVWANGHEESRVTVIVTDVNGQGVPDRSINLTANPPDGLIITPKKQPVITNASGEASFVVTSNQTGVVVLTATDDDESTLTTSAEIEFIQRRVVIFVQGIQTELAFSNIGNVFPTIRDRLAVLGFKRPVRDTPEMDRECVNAIDDDGDGTPNDGCPLIIEYSYNGGLISPDNGIWRSRPYGCKDTAQRIALSITKLKEHISLFSQFNPNTRFIIIGHSQGGLIGLHALELAETQNIIIDAFISLDGALGGSPKLSTLIADAFSCWGNPAVNNLIQLWKSTSEHDFQGTKANFSDQSNEDLVVLAQKKGVIVVTVGSFDDCVWNPQRCGFTLRDNTSSQIIENADIRSLLELGANCSLKPCISESHNIVLVEPKVLDIIQLTVQSPISLIMDR